MSEDLIEQLNQLTTPHLADGCLATQVPIRCAPPGIRPLTPTMRCAGRVRPVRHVGSIDVFFEAFEKSARGDVLVIDNGGRLDEACIGDIVALEAMTEGVVGFVIWGLHRDSRELSEMGLPVFSLGAIPTGPQRLNARPTDVLDGATIGAHFVSMRDFVVADDNGVLFLPEDRIGDIVAAAIQYRETEKRQLSAMRKGKSYRAQVQFETYMARKLRDPAYSFRQHIKDIAAAGEV
jgi:regulator of RNase E activity RraA